MSFVVIYANEKGAVIKGDSRMCDDENDIRSEDYQKVCKINDNLIMGYTGGVEFTLRVLTETTFRNYGHSGITDYVDALREKIIANIGNKAIKIKGGCFVVAGIEDGRVRVYVARCNEEIFEVNHRTFLQKKYSRQRTDHLKKGLTTLFIKWRI